MTQIIKNTNENFKIQTCCICLEDQTEFDIESNNKLIEYNHCGSYYVHNKCLNTWKLNECLICRKNFDKSSNQSSNEIISDNDDNDIITILVNQNDASLQYKTIFLNFCLIVNVIGIILYLSINN